MPVYQGFSRNFRCSRVSTQAPTKHPLCVALHHIPVLPALKAVLDVLPLDNLSFLVTAQGRPFTPAGFTNWFRDMVREAGLPDGLSPHGLRKATCRRLAEAGCTPHQIMAISGHKSLAEVTRYTVAAGRKDLAAQAMLALGKKEG